VRLEDCGASVLDARQLTLLGTVTTSERRLASWG